MDPAGIPWLPAEPVGGRGAVLRRQQQHQKSKACVGAKGGKVVGGQGQGRVGKLAGAMPPATSKHSSFFQSWPSAWPPHRLSRSPVPTPATKTRLVLRTSRTRTSAPPTDATTMAQTGNELELVACTWKGTGVVGSPTLPATSTPRAE